MHTHTPAVLAAGVSEIFDHQHAENLTNQNDFRAEQVPGDRGVPGIHPPRASVPGVQLEQSHRAQPLEGPILVY